MITISKRNAALKIIAEYLTDLGTSSFIQAVETSSGRVLIKAWISDEDILDIVAPEHKCTFAMYVSEGVKKCVDCGKEEPLFGLEVKHERDNGYG